MPASQNTVGIYIHIPFCERKCPYCDFYSATSDESEFDRYIAAVCSRMETYAQTIQRKVDTLYFGGGTPSIIGAKRLCTLKNAVSSCFHLDSPEITVEVNPAKNDFDFELLRKNGFNRISIGLQSANDNELQLLGRLHSVSQADIGIQKAQAAGFDNISLDLMLCTPQQTKDSLLRSIAFCAEHHVQHISAYILKLEEGTPYWQNRTKLHLPDDDEQAEVYLFACEQIENYGYKQYEISNFSQKNRQSRHNLKYWHDEEYLGIGPSAHSFLNGKRFYYGRSFDDFYADTITADGTGGDTEEYLMLGLRLSEGIRSERFKKRFGFDIPDIYFQNAEKMKKYGLVKTDQNGFQLTRSGFLVSNAVIAEILKND